jgi:hypothetical protein
MSDFELHALAFADLIERVAAGQTASSAPSSPPEPPSDLPLFSSIRCICGENENVGELIQCHDCHCFLHLRCIDQQAQRSGNFRCPFCALQLDGVDPFRELHGFIDGILVELKSLHGLISEATSIEAQISALMVPAAGLADYGVVTPPVMRGRQGVPQLRTALTRIMQEISQHVTALAGQ